METNELMLAIEQMLIKNLNASIIAHGQTTVDTCAADFQCIIAVSYTHLTLPTNREV